MFYGFCAAAVLLWTAGCGDNENAGKYLVTGTVTLDGEPLESGTVVLVAQDAAVASAAGKIEKGSYSFYALPGSKKVEITQTRVVPGITQADVGNPGDDGPVYKQYLPARYNTRSTLTAEVKPDGENKFDFELNSEDSK